MKGSISFGKDANKKGKQRRQQPNPKAPRNEVHRNYASLNRKGEEGWIDVERTEYIRMTPQLTHYHLNELESKPCCQGCVNQQLPLLNMAFY